MIIKRQSIYFEKGDLYLISWEGSKYSGICIDNPQASFIDGSKELFDRYLTDLNIPWIILKKAV